MTSNEIAYGVPRSVLKEAAFGFPVGNPKLLDVFPGAAAAYSLRKVNTAYNGPAIRVRRSSDSATTDIGFTVKGDLDEVALTTFVGAGSGFVSIWYDQSGNTGRDAIQATAANQPRIINAGAVEYDRTKPAIYFDGAAYTIGGSNFTAMSTSNSSFYLVGKSFNVPSSGNAGIVRVSNGAAYANNITPVFVIGRAIGANFAAYYWGGGYGINTNINVTTGELFSSIISGNTTIQIYKNGAIIATGTRTPTSWSTGTFSATFGSYITTNIEYRRCYVKEFILYSTSNANQIQIEQNINSYYAIY